MRYAAGNICLWMSALADGGLSTADREVVLRGLEPAYSEAVAEFRRMIGRSSS